jgi:DNA-binding transcriptional LysR family regulator
MAKMMDWDDLRFALAVARAGNLAKAARSLGVAHTTVARRITAFEDVLGAPLFDRVAGDCTPTPGMTYYNASKAGLAAASEALRGELRGSGVNVVTVYPGIVATDMADAGLAAYGNNLALRLQPKGTASGLAAIVKHAILRRHARVVYPRSYFFVRWMGPVVRWFMDRFSPALAEAS